MSDLTAAPEPSFSSSLWLWFRRVAWAPVAVLVFHQIIAHTAWRRPLDFLMHSLGGAAMAFVMWHGSEQMAAWLGRLTLLGRLLLSFCFALTVGVFWEFAEQLSDMCRGTHIQLSVSETMKDLWADATGAAVTLALMRACSSKP